MFALKGNSHLDGVTTTTAPPLKSRASLNVFMVVSSHRD